MERKLTQNSQNKREIHEIIREQFLNIRVLKNIRSIRSIRVLKYSFQFCGFCVRQIPFCVKQDWTLAAALRATALNFLSPSLPFFTLLYFLSPSSLSLILAKTASTFSLWLLAHYAFERLLP